MSDTSADKAFHTVLPPNLIAASPQLAQKSDGTGSDVVVALFTGLGAGAPKNGKVYVTFQAITNDFEVNFGPSNITTAANGMKVTVGNPLRVWINTNVITTMVQKGAAGSIRWYVSSPEYDGAGL